LDGAIEDYKESKRLFAKRGLDLKFKHLDFD